MSGLSFNELRSANVSRNRSWHPGFGSDDSWTGGDWSNAMCGEAGEAANIVKKIRRHETRVEGAVGPPPEDLRVALAHELADLVIYADLLAFKYGINLGDALVEKFNLVSEREGLPERLLERAA